MVMRTISDTRVYDGGNLNYEDKPKVAPAPHNINDYNNNDMIIIYMM